MICFNDCFVVYQKDGRRASIEKEKLLDRLSLEKDYVGVILLLACLSSLFDGTMPRAIQVHLAEELIRQLCHCDRIPWARDCDWAGSGI